MHLFANKRLIFILILLFWIEVSILPFCSIRGIKPDLIFIFITFYAFQIDWKRLVPLAFVLGIIRDLLTNSFFGLETASFVGGALLLQFFADQFYRERWIQILGLFLFSWATLILYSIFTFITEGHYFNERMLAQTFFISIYTTVIGAILFPIFEKRLKQVLYVKQYELF